MEERMLQLHYLLSKEEAHDLALVLDDELFRVAEAFIDGKKSLLEVRAKLYEFNSSKYYRYAEEFELNSIISKLYYYQDSIMKLFNEEGLTDICDRYMSLSDMQTLLLYIKENAEESQDILTREFQFSQTEFETILELIE